MNPKEVALQIIIAMDAHMLEQGCAFSGIIAEGNGRPTCYLRIDDESFEVCIAPYRVEESR
jgi:hypothetical protein